MESRRTIGRTGNSEERVVSRSTISNLQTNFLDVSRNLQFFANPPLLYQNKKRYSCIQKFQLLKDFNIDFGLNFVLILQCFSYYCNPLAFSWKSG